jgi:5-methylthioadenosine/S-adenosylhomocysteine deaminase
VPTIERGAAEHGRALSTLLRDGHIISLDDTIGDLPHGDVLIDGDTIVAVGTDLGACGTGRTGRTGRTTVVDAAGKIVIPGLIDSHRHVWQSAIGGRRSPGGHLDIALARLRDGYAPEDVYAGVLWGALQAIDAGITTVADWSPIGTTPAHADENVRALRDSGIRGLFLYGPPIGGNVMKWFVESTERHPADVVRMRAERLSDDTARVTMGLALRGPEFSTPEVTEYDFHLARDLALPISIHSGLPAYLARYRTIETLDEGGLLGPDVHHTHGVRFSGDDLTRIAATGGSVTPCPVVDMSMAMSTYPVTGRAVAHGLLPALATDTPTGTGPDLFGEMRIALTAERARANAAARGRAEPFEPVELGQRDVLRFCTVAGAAAWDMSDRIGTISPGKRADLVLIDPTHPQLCPLNDAAGTLVLNASPAEVDTVIIDGRILKRAGRLTGPAAARVHRLIETSRRRLLARADLSGVADDIQAG